MLHQLVPHVEFSKNSISCYALSTVKVYSLWLAWPIGRYSRAGGTTVGNI